MKSLKKIAKTIGIALLIVAFFALLPYTKDETEELELTSSKVPCIISKSNADLSCEVK